MRKQLDEMESTRLELLPLVLESLERVRSGELSCRDFDNSLGRVRLRVQQMKTGMEALREQFDGLERSGGGMDIQKRIEVKRSALQRFSQKIEEGKK